MYGPETYHRIVEKAMECFGKYRWEFVEGYPDGSMTEPTVRNLGFAPVAKAWAHGLDCANEGKPLKTALREWDDKQRNKRLGAVSRHGLSLF